MSFSLDEFQKALDRFEIDTGYLVRAIEVDQTQWREILDARIAYNDGAARDVYEDGMVHYAQLLGVRIYQRKG